MNIKERIFKLNKRGTFFPPGFWYLTGLMKIMFVCVRGDPAVCDCHVIGLDILGTSGTRREDDREMLDRQCR